MIENILILIISYLLGSIPFGYLITKISTKKKKSRKLSWQNF
jgi:glycerol-3-phosphate acyltransferase PlsY